MIQRDILQDQIKELARVLSTILGKFIGFKTSGEIQVGIDKTSKQLKAKLDIDLGELIHLSQNDLKSYLIERKITKGHFQILANYLLEIGKAKMSYQKKEAKIYLQKSIELLEIEDEISETLCLDRMNQKTNVNMLIQELL